MLAGLSAYALSDFLVTEDASQLQTRQNYTEHSPFLTQAFTFSFQLTITIQKGWGIFKQFLGEYYCAEIRKAI